MANDEFLDKHNRKSGFVCNRTKWRVTGSNTQRFFSIFKKSAKNAQISAEKLGVYIPFEDFYSTYLLATWKAIEDYRLERKKKELKFKNLFLYRLAIAEKDVWRLYKKSSNNKNDKNRITYDAGRWQSLDPGFIESQSSVEIDSTINLKEMVCNYQKQEPLDGFFFSLLVEGFTCSEAAKIMFSEKDYHPSVRKRVERMKKRLKKYLLQEKYFLNTVTNSKKSQHI
ncbi:BacL2 family protein [Enterococcus sp. DIV1368c]|uniref:BacL2 family protein n=1 Tax=Enterococcus sp. DIV1368c TaxID=2774815 RepID=UPI003F689107